MTRSFTLEHLISALALSLLTCLAAQSAMANDSVFGSGSVAAVEKNGAAVTIDLSVAALGPGGGPAQGNFTARIHSDDGDIFLQSEVQSVGGPAGGSPIILGGIGTLQYDASSESHVPWHAKITTKQNSVEVDFSFTSSDLGHQSYSGDLDLGSVERAPLASIVNQSCAFAGYGENTTSGESMAFSYGAFFGAAANDGFGSLTALVSSATCPDAEAVVAVVSETESQIDSESGDLHMEMRGVALVYLASDPNNPVLGNFTLTVDEPSVTPIGYFNVASMTVLDIRTNDPIACVTQIQTDDPVVCLVLN